MRSKLFRFIASALLISLFASIIPFMISDEEVKAAYTYDVNAAMSYAKAHYNDGNGDLCAAFVSRCVKAGGLDVAINTGTGDVHRAITKATGVNLQDLKLNSNGFATKDLDGNILQRGDVVFIWCYSHDVSPHVVICDGYDSSGIAIFYGKNASYYGRYRMDRYTSGYGHTSSCKVGAKVQHIAQPPKDPVNYGPSSRIIPDGDYTIALADTSKGLYLLDFDGSNNIYDGCNTVIWGPYSVQPNPYDAWTITYNDGYYKIKQKTSDKVLDIAYHSTDAGANVQAYTGSQNGWQQHWVIEHNGNGYRFVNRNSGLSLDNAGATIANQNNVQQWTKNDSIAQRWIIIPYKQGQPVIIKDVESTNIIKNVKVTDISSTGYKVTCELADYAISKVCFPTWTEPEGKDDLFSNWETSAVGTMSGNTVTYYVRTSEHQNQNGCNYVTNIYAYDYFGNRVCLTENQDIKLEVKVPKPSVTPTWKPTATPAPKVPTKKPANPTVTPTTKPSPSKKPAGPTATPTKKPVAKPTTKPTTKPVKKPTATPTKKPAVVSLSLNTYSANVVCGKTLALKASLKGSKSKITWKSSDTSIATVDAYGNVSGKKAGPVAIYASAAGKTVRCNVQVLYKDVTNAKRFWYAPTNYLTNKGVVKGYNNQTRFRPANKCTRAQMVTFIWRLEGCPEPSTNKCKFKDVKKSDYFYNACIWGNEQGIVEGYKDGTFGPTIVCARRHAVTFLWRLAGEPDPVSSKNPFSDVKKKDYFYTATLWASEQKILEGYSDGTFRPNGDCLRRQMVTFLYKYDKYVNGKG